VDRAIAIAHVGSRSPRLARWRETAFGWSKVPHANGVEKRLRLHARGGAKSPKATAGAQ